MRALDAIDATILVELQRDGRISNKALAELVGLAPSSCLERVRRLRDEGILQRTVADIDAAAVGVGVQVLVGVTLTGCDAASRRALIARLSTLQEVVQLFELGGAADLLLHLACRDPGHLAEILDGPIRGAPEVSGATTSIVLGHMRGATPIYR